MKTLPTRPYLQNIVSNFHAQGGHSIGTTYYREWLSQFGFTVPISGDYLEFPDDFSDQELFMFILRWS